MLRRSTAEIIQACIKVKDEYEESYEGKGYQGRFYKEHGQKGADRKEDFIKVYETIHQDSEPEEAFIKLYNFYKARSKGSTLVNLLEKELAKLIGIEIPELKAMGNKSGVDAIHAARNEFRELAQSIVREHEMEDGFTLENWKKNSHTGN